MLHCGYRKRTEGELWEVYLADRSNPHVQQKPYSDYLKSIKQPVNKTDKEKSTKELIAWAEQVKEIDKASSK